MLVYGKPILIDVSCLCESESHTLTQDGTFILEAERVDVSLAYMAGIYVTVYIQGAEMKAIREMLGKYCIRGTRPN